MTKLNNFRHPAHELATDKQRDVVDELEALLADPSLSPWTESVIEITAHQIREAEDGLNEKSGRGTNR